MRNTLLKFHRYTYSKYEIRLRDKSKNKVIMTTLQILYRATVVLFNLYLNVVYIFGFKVNKLDSNGNIIVSFTSFPARISGVWKSVDSLFHQKYQPNRIILVLSRDQFLNEFADLPQKLLRYQKFGLEIQFKDDDIKPHKKYLYTIQDNRESLVITIDDDLYYQPDMIDRLISMHHKFPNCVCANKVNCIKFNSDNTVKPYIQWRGTPQLLTPNHTYLGVGFAGILYPSHLFNDHRMFNIEDIKKCALRADDLWLKAFELLNNIPVVTGDYYCSSISILGAQAVSLRTTNCNHENSQNDVQWKAINEMYDVDKILLDSLRKYRNE